MGRLSSDPSRLTVVIPKNEQSYTDTYSVISVEATEKFIRAKENESILSREPYSKQDTETEEYWTFKKLKNGMVDGYSATVVENTRVWDALEYNERIYIVKKNNIFYEIGGFYKKESDPVELLSFVKSFKFAK